MRDIWKKFSVLALCCLLLSGCMAGVEPEPTEPAVSAMAVLAAGSNGTLGRITYADVLRRLQERWGPGAVSSADGGIRGLWLVQLLDLNRDGTKELLIRYRDEDAAVDRAELWTVDQGGARRLYIGAGRRETDGSLSLAFYEIGGQWLLCTGSLNPAPRLALYGLQNGRLEHLHGVSADPDRADCLLDGVSVSSRELDTSLQTWEAHALVLRTPQTPEAAAEALEQTAQTLARFLP